MIIPISDQPLSLELSHTFSAKRECIFRAWTQPELLEQWFGPEGYSTTVLQMDFQVGGNYRFSMQSEDNSNEIIYLNGIFREIVAPEKIVYSWKWETPQSHETLVTIHFYETNGFTEVLLKHENFDRQSEVERHNQGWNSSMVCFYNAILDIRE